MRIKATIRLFMISALFVSINAFASPLLHARLEIGLNILPSVIAANKWLAAKEDGERTPVTIYVVYHENKKLAQQAVTKLERIEKIHGHRCIIKATSVEQLFTESPGRYSALIIIEPLVEIREQLIDFTRQRQALLFSPFKGDVKKGVMAGYEVTNKVLPAVNSSALKDANIRLKAFFLRIAVSHD